MGSDSTELPEYQMGEGCLVDQLVGQYQADVAGLGPLVDPERCRKTLQSIYRYNYKREMFEHANVERTFALNDEAALVISDYGRGVRPDVPFPYFAEVMTGFEYTAASQMIFAGMVHEGIECITNIRRRYDGERRNPWDEAECGSHYARAMAAWSGVLALSGFRYDGPNQQIWALPRLPAPGFRSVWATGTGWGSFAYGAAATGFHRSCSVRISFDAFSGSVSDSTTSASILVQSSSCTWTLAQRFHSSASRSSWMRGVSDVRTACSRTIRSSRSCFVGSGPIVPTASLTSFIN
jgi:hypothetical protein